MNYSGFYINLDRHVERRMSIEQELARHGLHSYQRFTASDGNALHFPKRHLKESELGCFTSHYRLLFENRTSRLPLHIIEDDIILSPQMESILDQMLSRGDLDEYDIVYTDVAMPIKNRLFYGYKNFYDANVKRDKEGKIIDLTFSIIDLKKLIFASTCSYLVNPRSIEKLLVFYQTELARGATLPIDLYIRDLCHRGLLRVVCIFPFITSIQPESCFATSMEGRFELMPALAANILRHSFFIGCDWNQCLKYVRRVFPQPDENDIHRQLMLCLLGSSLLEEA